MKLFLKKIIKKYRDMSVEMKAASWYAVGNIIQKIAPWLVMIILTHYLATEEYGIYSGIPNPPGKPTLPLIYSTHAL